jgi:hypothetical protein
MKMSHNSDDFGPLLKKHPREGVFIWLTVNLKSM